MPKQRATPWIPVSGLPGYERRHNEDGYLETRPIVEEKMTTGKVIVPEGMLKAAWAAMSSYKVTPESNSTEEALKGALRWLSENPIVPTDEQVVSILKVASPQQGYRNVCIEWQRRMFLAPQEETDPLDNIFDHFTTAYVPKGAVRVDVYSKSGTLLASREIKAPEPEIPEDVKDLLVQPHGTAWRGDELNSAVIEAYRRGQRSK